MSIIRTARAAEGNFTQIANRLLQDSRISDRARGLACRLLSYPPNTRIESNALADGTREGRDAVRAALRELESFGYLVRTRTQDERGHWSTESFLTDGPTPSEPKPGKPSPVRPAPMAKTAGRTGDGFSGAKDQTRKEETRTTPPTPQRPAAEGVGSADGGGDKKLATGTDTAYLDAARTFCQQAGYQAQQKTVAQLAADLANLFTIGELPKAIELASTWGQPDRACLGTLRARVRKISSQMKAGDQVTAMRRPRAGFVLRAAASPEGHEEVSTTLHDNWAKFDDPQQAAN